MQAVRLISRQHAIQGRIIPEDFGSGNMGQAFYIECVEQAAEIAGGYDKLAERLGFTHEEVLSWLRGCRVPAAAFLRIIDIALQDPAKTTRPTSIVSRTGQT
ncbi:MAG TPA: YdaS family helix-turn-helix protein [Pseudoxanthomonas sp.]|nr:YdaS family helix-turn-helix protein [Pseudoxanthomonas sp.]